MIFSSIDPQLRKDLYFLLAKPSTRHTVVKLNDVFVYNPIKQHMSTMADHAKYQPYVDIFNQQDLQKTSHLQRLFVDGMERYCSAMPDSKSCQQQQRDLKMVEFSTMAKEHPPTEENHNHPTLVAWAFYNQVRADIFRIRQQQDNLSHEELIAAFTAATSYREALSISRKINPSDLPMTTNPEFASRYLTNWWKDHATDALNHLVFKQYPHLVQQNPKAYYRLVMKLCPPPMAKRGQDYDAKLEIKDLKVVLELPDCKTEFLLDPSLSSIARVISNTCPNTASGQTPEDVFNQATRVWIQAIYDQPLPKYNCRYSPSMLYAEGYDKIPPPTELFTAMINYIDARMATMANQTMSSKTSKTSLIDTILARESTQKKYTPNQLKRMKKSELEEMLASPASTTLSF